MQCKGITLFSCVLKQVCMRLCLCLCQHQSRLLAAALVCVTTRFPAVHLWRAPERLENRTHSSAGDSCSSLSRFKPYPGFVFLMPPIQKLACAYTPLCLKLRRNRREVTIALVYKRENCLTTNFMVFHGHACTIDLPCPHNALMW